MCRPVPLESANAVADFMPLLSRSANQQVASGLIPHLQWADWHWLHPRTPFNRWMIPRVVFLAFEIPVTI